MKASVLLPLFLLQSLISIPSSSPTLLKVLPLLWADTKQSLKGGESEAILIIKFEKPCEKFYDAKIVPDTKDYFVKWCNEESIDTIIRPLEQMCKPGFTGKSRKKRFLGFLAAIPTVIGAATSIFGLFSKPKPPERDPAIDQIISKIGVMDRDIQDLKDRIKAGEQRQAELDRKLEELRKAQAELDSRMAKAEFAIEKIITKIGDMSKEIQHINDRIAAGEKRHQELADKVAEMKKEMEELDKRMRKAEINIEQIQQWKAELTETLGPTMTLVAKLQSYFQVSQGNLNEVAREWREGRLSLKLFDVFMMGTDWGMIDMYRNAQPVECHIDARDGVASFRFKKNDTDFGVHVLKAFPFTMYEMKEGTDLGYKLEYIGPNQVVYDADQDCIVPFTAEAVEVLMFPNEKDCLPMNQRSVYKYWRKTCELMYYLDDNVIQVKAIDNQYYIYCYGFEIMIYKNIHKCPKYVFSVNVREDIKILNGKAVSKWLKPSNFEPSVDFHSTKAVYHIIPRIMELDFDTFPVANSCPIISSGKAIIDGSNVTSAGVGGKGEDSVGRMFVLAGFAVMTIALFIISALGFFYIQTRTKERDVTGSSSQHVQMEFGQRSVPPPEGDSLLQK